MVEPSSGPEGASFFSETSFSLSSSFLAFKLFSALSFAREARFSGRSFVLGFKEGETGQELAPDGEEKMEGTGRLEGGREEREEEEREIFRCWVLGGEISML
jgi:hypothetical protein